MKLTDDQMIELMRARARFEAYCDKIQPYPPYPDEEVPEPKPQVIEHIVRHSQMSKKEFNVLQQTALKVDYLEKELNELKARRKPKGQY